MMDFVGHQKFDRLGIFTYSHEEKTHSYAMPDDVAEETKQQRANDVMELQASISEELNAEKIGKTMKILIDRKEGNHFIGRTEFDSPEVDNEVLLEAKYYLRVGDFVNAKIIGANAFDLIAEPVPKNDLSRIAH